MVYNIFISNSWAYSTYLDQLKAILAEYPYFSYKEFLIQPADPILAAGTDTALRMTLENRMRLCHATLILADAYETHARLINLETAVAATLGIPVIAASNTPDKFAGTLPADIAEFVPMDASNIVGAIRKHAKVS